MVVCSEHVQDLAFAPSPSEVAVGLGPFCILWHIIALNCTCLKLYLVPYSFFVLLLGEIQVQALQQRVLVPGPSLSQCEQV